MAVYVIDDTTVPDDLNGAINASVLTVTLTDGSTYPAADFVILINAEEIDIQSRTGNVLTVRTGGRGYGDTIAASHADADQATHVVTNQDLPFRRTVAATTWEAQGDVLMGGFDIDDVIGVKSIDNALTLTATSTGASAQNVNIRADDQFGTTRNRIEIDGDGVITMRDNAGNDIFRVADTYSRTLQPFWLPPGLVGAPSLTTQGDLDTGIFFPVADSMAMVAGGVEFMRFVEDTTDYVEVFEDVLISNVAPKLNLDRDSDTGGASQIQFMTAGVIKMRMGIISTTAGVEQFRLENYQGDMWFLAKQNVGDGHSNMYWYVDDSGSTTRLRMEILGDGNHNFRDDAGNDRFSITPDGVLLPLKATTGDPTGVEGLLYVNTSDNKIRVYADAAWRDLATW